MPRSRPNHSARQLADDHEDQDRARDSEWSCRLQTVGSQVLSDQPTHPRTSASPRLVFFARPAQPGAPAGEAISSHALQNRKRVDQSELSRTGSFGSGSLWPAPDHSVAAQVGGAGSAFRPPCRWITLSRLRCAPACEAAARRSSSRRLRKKGAALYRPSSHRRRQPNPSVFPMVPTRLFAPSLGARRETTCTVPASFSRMMAMLSLVAELAETMNWSP